MTHVVVLSLVAATSTLSIATTAASTPALVVLVVATTASTSAVPAATATLVMLILLSTVATARITTVMMVASSRLLLRVAPTASRRHLRWSTLVLLRWRLLVALIRLAGPIMLLVLLPALVKVVVAAATTVGNGQVSCTITAFVAAATVEVVMAAAASAATAASRRVLRLNRCHTVAAKAAVWSASTTSRWATALRTAAPRVRLRRVVTSWLTTVGIVPAVTATATLSIVHHLRLWLVELMWWLLRLLAWHDGVELLRLLRLRRVKVYR